MKNLKFRVYHKQLERFLSPEEWTIDFNGKLIFVDMPPDVKPGDYVKLVAVDPILYTIQQYIGINDKNGVEIYEGDILYGEVDTRETFENVTIGDIYTFKGEVIYGCYRGFYVDEADFGLDSYTTLEVLGNICQPSI